MKILLQRVVSASVRVDNQSVAEIKNGLLLLVGFRKGDSVEDAEKFADKILKARIFNDDEGKMNKNLMQVQGEVLVVSQFTLYANLSKGNRPSFIDAALPDEARMLYAYFCNALSKRLGKEVEKGIFGADMKVSLVNDGPVTLLYES